MAIYLERTTPPERIVVDGPIHIFWKEEFDGAYEEGTMYILTMHPQVIGHRYRMKMLDDLVTYMKSKPGGWFATHEEIAKYVESQQ